MIHRYKPKHSKTKETNSLFHLLLPSVLSICICCVCLIGSTLAWFHEGVQVSNQKLTSANYDVNTVMVLGGEEIPKVNGVYLLEAEKTYTVTITAVGNATTGYCILKINDLEVQTEQFPTPADTENKTIYFNLTLEESAAVEIIAQLGFSSKTTEEKIENGENFYYSNVVE